MFTDARLSTLLSIMPAAEPVVAQLLAVAAVDVVAPVQAGAVPEQALQFLQFLAPDSPVRQLSLLPVAGERLLLQVLRAVEVAVPVVAAVLVAVALRLAAVAVVPAVAAAAEVVAAVLRSPALRSSICCLRLALT
jgi:hypothetical protein